MKDDYIVRKFVAVLTRWITKKQSGELALIININEGGITNWKIRTEGKEV